jgi:hypothetical protein
VVDFYLLADSHVDRSRGEMTSQFPASTINGTQPNSEKNQMLGRKSILQSFRSNVQFATKNDLQGLWTTAAATHNLH